MAKSLFGVAQPKKRKKKLLLLLNKVVDHENHFQ